MLHSQKCEVESAPRHTEMTCTSLRPATLCMMNAVHVLISVIATSSCIDDAFKCLSCIDTVGQGYHASLSPQEGMRICVMHASC